MAIKLHNSIWLLLALLSLAGVSGCCCQAIPLPGEGHCPTDARRLYCTCGEEAVRRCPCGPDHEFYGLKPTCWREWPEGWQCNGCEGFPYVDRNSCGAPCAEAPVAESPASEGTSLSNPFDSTTDASAPVAPTGQVESTVPPTMPTAPTGVKTTAAAPHLVAPQNTPAGDGAENPALSNRVEDHLLNNLRL